jgi:AraC-like DNA-binding protein
VTSPAAGIFHGTPRTAGLLTRLACARASAAGIELAPLLDRAHLSPEQIEDRYFRPASRDQVLLLDLIAEALEDDLLGFHLAESVDLREMGLLYYVPASAETLAAALRRVERYGVLGNEGVALRCAVVGARLEISLRFVGVSRHLDRHQTEGLMTAQLRMIRQLTGRRIVAERVRFVHARSRVPEELARFFGEAIEFGAGVDDLAVPAALAEAAVASADHYLHELLIRSSEDALAHRRPNRGDVRAAVENAIAPLLPHGEANADEVARRMGVSRRTLARRLADEGLNFEAVLEAMRRDLAERYLADRDLSISKIAWLLGYRESSALSRAYKRWTGRSPREARASARIARGTR